jgi:hypothetical protein
MATRMSQSHDQEQHDPEAPQPAARRRINFAHLRSARSQTAPETPESPIPADSEVHSVPPEAATSPRLRERENQLERYMRHPLIRCPRCGARAKGSEIVEGRPPTFRSGERVVPLQRVTCASCGYSFPERAEQPRQASNAESSDQRQASTSYVYVPLWLQTPCLGHVLWAYNQEHLDFIERSVNSISRGRQRQSVALDDDRLPRWMREPNEPDEVLRGVARLRNMLKR